MMKLTIFDPFAMPPISPHQDCFYYSIPGLSSRICRGDNSPGLLVSTSHTFVGPVVSVVLVRGTAALNIRAVLNIVNSPTITFAAATVV